jgi:hypothetical protein
MLKFERLQPLVKMEDLMTLAVVTWPLREERALAILSIKLKSHDDRDKDGNNALKEHRTALFFEVQVLGVLMLDQDNTPSTRKLVSGSADFGPG